jgi:hypothetical protein
LYKCPVSARRTAWDIALVLAELDLVRSVEVDRIGAERLMLDHDIVVDALEGGLADP